MRAPEIDHEVVRRALATWDPVRSEGEHGEAEHDLLRRRVLAAELAAGPRRRHRLAPVAALAATAAAVALLVVRQETPPAERPSRGSAVRFGATAGESSVPAGTDGPASAPVRKSASSPVAAPTATDDLPTLARSRGDERVILPATAAPARPHVAASVEHGTTSEAPIGVADPATGLSAATSPAPRQLQLVAPGGTRIVWLLAAATTPDAFDTTPTTLTEKEDV